MICEGIMTFEVSLILVSGATGFLGRHLVQLLVSQGREVRCLVRPSSDTTPLKDLKLELAVGDVTDPAALRRAMDGVGAAIHLVAVIREYPQRGVTFERVNRWGTRNVLEAAKAAGVRDFIHVGAIGSRDDPSFPYLHSKWLGEQEVINAGLTYTILRASIIFGEGDGFVTTLAKLVHAFPLVPVIGDGKTKFQYIWVKDVATCVTLCLDDPSIRGTTLEIGGPEIVTYEETVDLLAGALGKRRAKLHVPVPFMVPMVKFMEWGPVRSPITSAELKMVNLDNVTELDSVQRHFGFSPQRLADALDYVQRT